MPESPTQSAANSGSRTPRDSRAHRDRRATRGNASDRRGQIAWALDECIRKRGYAASTLTDIAAAAGMSPSHIHYYFEGKAAVLEYHFDELCEGILEDVLPFAEKAPIERIHATASYFFVDPKNSREVAGVWFEIFGVAVHSESVRDIKKRWDVAMRNFFVEIFLDAGHPDTAAQRAGEIAFGLLVGLRTNAFFDEDRTRAHAGEVFLGELLRLAEAPDTNTEAEASLEDGS